METQHGTVKTVLMLVNLVSLLVLLVTLLMLGRLPEAEEDLSFKVILLFLFFLCFTSR